MKNKSMYKTAVLGFLCTTSVLGVFAAHKHKHEPKLLPYTITCHITGGPEQEVMLENLHANDLSTVVDSQKSGADGRVVFHGTIPEPGLYRLHFMGDKFILLSLDEANVTVNGTWPITEYEVKGSDATTQMTVFINEAKLLMMHARKAKYSVDSAKANGGDGVSQAQDFLTCKTAFTDCVERYADTTSYQPDAIVAARVFGQGEEMKFLLSFDSLQHARYPDRVMTREFSEFVTRQKDNQPQPVDIGNKAPDLRLMDTTGKVVDLASLRGKYVLVDFWASWCGPCRAENPNVLAAYNKYKNRNFTIYGVSLDNKKDAWEKAIEHDQLPWRQVSDLKGWQSAAATIYGVRSIPTNFLVDPGGIIIGKSLRGQLLESKLDEVLRAGN